MLQQHGSILKKSIVSRSAAHLQDLSHLGQAPPRKGAAAAEPYEGPQPGGYVQVEERVDTGRSTHADPRKHYATKVTSQNRSLALDDVADGGYDLPEARGLQLLLIGEVLCVPDVEPLRHDGGRRAGACARRGLGEDPFEGGVDFEEVPLLGVAPAVQRAGEICGVVAPSVEEDDGVGVPLCRRDDVGWNMNGGHLCL